MSALPGNNGSYLPPGGSTLNPFGPGEIGVIAVIGPVADQGIDTSGPLGVGNINPDQHLLGGAFTGRYYAFYQFLNSLPPRIRGQLISPTNEIRLARFDPTTGQAGPGIISFQQIGGLQIPTAQGNPDSGNVHQSALIEPPDDPQPPDDPKPPPDSRPPPVQ